MSHPLHPALVHFLVACWSLATCADLASLAWGRPAWLLAGALLAIGTLSALAAMATGLMELAKLDADHPAISDVNRHMLLVMTAWSLYAASLFLRLDGTTLLRPDAIDIVLSMAGFVVLAVAGWFGGKLVYGHGVGVEKHRHTRPGNTIRPAENHAARAACERESPVGASRNGGPTRTRIALAGP